MTGKRQPAVFSDLDGTLVHFPCEFHEWGAQVRGKDKNLYTDTITGDERECVVLPKSTLGHGMISKRSLSLVDDLRQMGVLFVVVTGARKSTLLERWEYLPPADVYICENGGRIYLGSQDKLDREWSDRFQNITDDIETTKPENEREGCLWDVYRDLKSKGFDLDTRSYWANIRVNAEHEQIKDELAKLPAELTYAYNLGKCDIYPAVSGKGNACKYIKERFSCGSSYALFDDDNDLPMARAVDHCLLPMVRTPSVKEQVAAHPDWYVAENSGILATEEVIEEVMKRVATEDPSTIE
eukprot:GFYU01016418.1.p1 GENE.GFYU01016418.1~~GFYU01016418.1.p1  ORF type:complete len:297 (+),score=39.14 GFYU01016418.1:157-1047(+)